MYSARMTLLRTLALFMSAGPGLVGQTAGCGDSGGDAVPVERMPEPGGDSGASDSSVPAQRLELLTMLVGGGMCSQHDDCWYSMGVRAPDTLVLSDKEGELLFEISAAEFQHVGDLAGTSAFAQKVSDSLAGRDCFGFDIGISMEYRWQGERTMAVSRIDNCALSPEPGEPPKILYEVIEYLGTLRAAYLECPPWELSRDHRSGVDPLPQRALCWTCYGLCDDVPGSPLDPVPTTPMTIEPTPTNWLPAFPAPSDQDGGLD